MGVNLKGKSFLTLLDFTTDEIRYLLDIARQVKVEKRAGTPTSRFAGRTLAIVFEKRSTRTRTAFETSFGEEGGHAVFLSKDDIHLGVKEDLKDTARVLGRMFDAIAFRGFKQETVEVLAQWSGVPVYNGLTDLYHPTQILADFMTIEESLGSLKGRKLVFVGDSRNNMANSLMIGSAKMGLHFVACGPESLHTDPAIVSKCKEIAKQSGATVEVTEDVDSALKDADAVYTDVWASMGEEDKLQERIALLKPYQVNAEMMKKTGKAETIFLHCLPAVKGNEVTEDVFESPASRVFEEAENRKHTIKAVMIATLL
ncbi:MULTISPECIES: ornithine carbamoyltransferase [Mesotoga]|uniref:ornithine carbamoyltransferase n=1 Tax=Mesotoga TaxID=1184396 RepID=UPI002CFE0B09|nr:MULTISPECIES: ornithine carbamoyltransferase [Mesotoga]HPE54343.1 ornithine carbamoyltransferase [Mesotoga prima]HRX66127.1 ornithine carbamoyltransferase [Mesotoga sp.]